MLARGRAGFTGRALDAFHISQAGRLVALRRPKHFRVFRQNGKNSNWPPRTGKRSSSHGTKGALRAHPSDRPREQVFSFASCRFFPPTWNGRSQRPAQRISWQLFGRHESESSCVFPRGGQLLRRRHNRDPIRLEEETIGPARRKKTSTAINVPGVTVRNRWTSGLLEFCEWCRRHEKAERCSQFTPVISLKRRSRNSRTLTQTFVSRKALEAIEYVMGDENSLVARAREGWSSRSRLS